MYCMFCLSICMGRGNRLPTQASSRWRGPICTQTSLSSCQTQEVREKRLTCHYRAVVFCLIVRMRVECSYPRNCPLGNLPAHTFQDTQYKLSFLGGSGQTDVVSQEPGGKKGQTSNFSKNSSLLLLCTPDVVLQRQQHTWGTGDRTVTAAGYFCWKWPLLFFSLADLASGFQRTKKSVLSLDPSLQNAI